MTQKTEKKFNIHPNIFLLEEVFFSFSYMVIILCWLFTLFLVDDYNYYRSNFIKLSIYFSFIILLLLNLIHIIITKFRKTVFILNEDSFIKVSQGRTSILHFSDIVSFRYRKFVVGNGFGSIRTNKKKINIFFIIKNLSELVDSLQKNLSVQGRSAIFDEKEINEFTYRARFIEFTRNKTFLLIKHLLYSLLSTFLLNTIVAFFLWQLPVEFALVWIFFGGLLVISNNLITRFIFKRGVLKQLIKNPSDIPVCDFSKIYTYTSIISAVVYLICGIIYKNFLSYYLS